MIMANMQMQQGQYPCYTFGGMYRDSYDVKISCKVAAACKQTHQVVKLAKDFLSDFPIYAEHAIYISDGGIGVSGSPEVYVNKLARDIAPIRITGNYGSELMRGIINLKASLPNTCLFNTDFLKYINDSMKTFNDLKGENHLTFLLFKEAPWFYYNRLAIEQSYLTIRTPYMDKDLVKLMYQAPQDVKNRSERSVRLIMDGNPALGNIITDRGLLGNMKYPLSNMAESYYIFLTNAEYAYNYGMPQWLAKFDYVFKFMHFEKLFLGRHKFYHFRLWYRDELADYVKAILLDERTLRRPYLNRKFVEEIVEGHTKGYRNYTNEITTLLTIELIQRLLIEQN